MRGKYSLTEQEHGYWEILVEMYLEDMLYGNTEEVDLSQKDINPYQLGRILESFGWEEDEVNVEGYELDRWAYYCHPDHRDLICIYSCGITFELKLSIIVHDENG